MSDQPIAVNRQARFNYFISDTFEAGIVLFGSEVKSIREGKVNLKDAYVRFSGREIYVVGLHISPYSHSANVAADDPTRTRKLLLHKHEIARLIANIAQKGLTCVPLSLYFKKGVVKIEIGIAKGKKQHDKRDSIKKKENERELRQALKHKTK